MSPAEIFLTGDYCSGVERIVGVSLNIMERIRTVAYFAVPDIAMHIMAHIAIKTHFVMQVFIINYFRNSGGIRGVADIASSGYADRAIPCFTYRIRSYT